MSVKHKFRQFSATRPTFVLELSNPVLTSEPSVFSAHDDNHINGHGFGYGPDTHLKALGEYVERFVAFRDIGSSGRTTIDELDVPSETRRALKAAIAETCLDGQLKKSLSTHKFATVEVRDLRTGNACKLLHVLFSLHSSTSSMDQQFIPIRDTSGSALHPNRDLALQGAVLEFVERQSLTAMWAAKRCQASFVLQPSDVFNPGMKALTQRLTTRGRLVCHDISFLKGAHAFLWLIKLDQKPISCSSRAGHPPRYPGKPRSKKRSSRYGRVFFFPKWHSSIPPNMAGII